MGGDDGAVVFHGHPFDLQGADLVFDEHELLIATAVPGKVSSHSPVVQGFCQLEQVKVGGGWSVQDGSHPIGERLDGFVGGSDGGRVDRDEVWLGVGTAGPVLSGVAVHEAVFALLNPFDGAVQAVAHGDAEVREVDVFDIPFRRRFERIFVFLDLTGQPLDLHVEGISGHEVLLRPGLEGADKAAAYDPKCRGVETWVPFEGGGDGAWREGSPVEEGHDRGYFPTVPVVPLAIESCFLSVGGEAAEGR